MTVPIFQLHCSCSVPHVKPGFTTIRKRIPVLHTPSCTLALPAPDAAPVEQMFLRWQGTGAVLQATHEACGCGTGLEAGVLPVALRHPAQRHR